MQVAQRGSDFNLIGNFEFEVVMVVGMKKKVIAGIYEHDIYCFQD